MIYRVILVIKIIALICICIVYNPFESYADPPTPPLQPEYGPGGNDYLHDNVKTSGPYWADGYEGDENYQYYISEPAEPTPRTAPVVLFLHGWQANSPNIYNSWIYHIGRNGYTVVWVRYQNPLSFPWRYIKHIITAWEDALKKLKRDPGRVRPQRGPDNRILTAYVGHSIGAYLGAIIAAKANEMRSRYPNPLALVLIEPGGQDAVPTRARFSDIPTDTKVVILSGEDDEVVCTSTAAHIWDHIPQIPDENKDFLLAQTDRTGVPEQIANHFFPTSKEKWDTAAIDCRDYYITYKLSVGALNCAIYGEDCQYALGGGAFDQVYNGLWSNGTPVKPLLWIENPDELEVNCSNIDSIAIKKANK